MALTASALLIGAVLGLAVGSCGLAIVGLAYVFSMDAVGRSESIRNGCRREAGCQGVAGSGTRPAEPDRDALLRAYRGSGWIDIDTVRRYSR